MGAYDDLYAYTQWEPRMLEMQQEYLRAQAQAQHDQAALEALRSQQYAARYGQQETVQQKQERLFAALHAIFGDTLPDFLDSVRGEAMRKLGGYPTYVEQVELRFARATDRDTVIITDSLGGHVELDAAFGRALVGTGDARAAGRIVWQRLCASRAGRAQAPTPAGRGVTATFDLNERYLNDATRDTIRVGRALLQALLP